jgi:hypothetical protein
MDKIKIIALIALGYLVFKKVAAQPAAPRRTGSIIPSNLPTGVKLVFSKVGTIIFDRDFNNIYEYDMPNYGIAVTGEKGYDMYSVVIGNDFLNGIQGFVLKSDVTEK